ncbi:rod shape-determining protein MreD [Nicoliella spurrieriana]|uniref:Rod shape-determining protein MreD n=1 Tax=Nicoliella spurrieriana TaxID=2925830 RepID=A0A976RS45_9LACO|nr:rod shape-determining protein MreD [Nicoliella spurrieriana]UQS86809.1 rod shape-determining protein MreD [Nicoliella spurrieriana]
MLRNSPLRFVFPIGLYIAFCLDGSVSQIFSKQLFGVQSFVPCITLLWLIFGLMFENEVNLHLGIWAFVTGFVMDTFYFGTLGVFVFILPLAIYICRLSYRYLSATFISGFLIYFIGVTISMSFSFLANRFVHLANITATNFLVSVLGPSLAFNLVLFIITYYPVSLLFDHYREKE